MRLILLHSYDFLNKQTLLRMEEGMGMKKYMISIFCLMMIYICNLHLQEKQTYVAYVAMMHQLDGYASYQVSFKKTSDYLISTYPFHHREFTSTLHVENDPLGSVAHGSFQDLIKDEQGNVYTLMKKQNHWIYQHASVISHTMIFQRGMMVYGNHFDKLPDPYMSAVYVEDETHIRSIKVEGETWILKLRDGQITIDTQNHVPYKIRKISKTNTAQMECTTIVFTKMKP